MKNNKTIKLLLIAILVFCSSGYVLANNYKTKTYVISESEVQEFEKNKLKNNLTEDGIEYQFSTYEKEEVKDSKTETKVVEKQNLRNNTEEYLKNNFPQEVNFNENGYEGTLILQNFDVQVVDQGTYEILDTKTITISNVDENDLDKVEKERIINGTRYYLIRTDWSVSNNITIDNTEVPTKYNGVSTYQAVLTREYPDLYNVKANYTGSVEKVNKDVKYKVSYNKIEIAEEKENNYIPVIIGGMSIIVLIAMYFIFRGNATIYNNVEGQFVKLAKIRIRKNKKIYLNKYAYKIKSNNYKLKINEKSFNKLKDTTIKFIKDNKEVEATIKVEEFKFNI